MVTIHDVAKRANVAISTVSNVLNKRKHVSDEITKRVLDAVQALGYEVDPVAQNMKSNSSKMIGIIVTKISRIFFLPLIRSVQKAADENGYKLVTMDSDDDFGREQEYLNYFCKNRFDGIIVDSVAEIDDQDYFRSLAKLSYRNKRIAVVSVERNLSQYGVDSVVVDNYSGAKTATEHLLALGCKKIIHVTGPLNSNMAENRLKGYLDTISYLNSEIAFGDFSPQSGYMTIKKYIDNHSISEYDAIFASNDQMAVGVLKALREADIKVPEDIKIVGFDDSIISSILDPALTTVKISNRVMGTESAKLLFKRISEQGRPIECKTIPTKLIVRHSTDATVPAEWDLLNW